MEKITREEALRRWSSAKAQKKGVGGENAQNAIRRL